MFVSHLTPSFNYDRGHEDGLHRKNIVTDLCDVENRQLHFYPDKATRETASLMRAGRQKGSCLELGTRGSII
jgi:hypothetical protein